MKLSEIRKKLAGVTLYRDVFSDPVLFSLTSLIKYDGDNICDALKLYSSFFGTAADAGCTESLASHILSLVKSSDNAFSRCIAYGSEATPSVFNAAKNDIELLFFIAGLDTEKIKEILPIIKNENQLPKVFSASVPEIFNCSAESAIESLCEFYKHNGCGIYSKFTAFTWNKGIIPVTHPDSITLSMLKGYQNERERVVDNTDAFVKGLPASNMLLYGDRGTGKSATVHAILNEYSCEGLRMLEIPLEHIAELSAITNELRGQPLKFILFIDDLSFDEWDEGFSALKAMLEGSLSARPENVLIYATSNRRHLVREYHSDREGDDVHLADTMQEMLSLSDRFGITVTFTNPLKAQYLEIVDGIAKDRGLSIDSEKLHAAAERWAISRSGRSPRVACQFVDYVFSKVKRGLEI